MAPTRLGSRARKVVRSGLILTYMIAANGGERGLRRMLGLLLSTLDQGGPQRGARRLRAMLQHADTMHYLYRWHDRNLPRNTRRLLGLLLLHGDADEITFQRNDTTWTGLMRDLYVSWSVFITGDHQLGDIEALLDWMVAHRPLGPIRNAIVDSGANIGTTSIPLAQRTQARIVAIEPLVDNFGLLTRNVVRNGLEQRIHCVQAAVSDVPERGVITMIIDEDNSGNGQVLERDSAMPSVATGKRAVEVPADSLDRIVRSCEIAPEQVAFVWSDTQGFERQVIDSGSSLWSAGVPLYVEVWPSGIARHGGVDLFLASALRNFESMISIAELRQDRHEAASHPIAALSQLVAGMHSEDATDVLLLPPGWDRAE